MAQKNKKHQNVEKPKTEIQNIVEEYKPSESKQNYDHIKKSEYLYKIIASRSDYIKLQEEVSQHLNDGWNLAGGVSTSIYSDSFSSSTIFTQAVFKTK